MKQRLTQQYKNMKFRMSDNNDPHFVVLVQGPRAMNQGQGPPLQTQIVDHVFSFIDVMHHCTKQGSHNSIQEFRKVR